MSDERQEPELVTLHLYRDTCVGGIFLSERELDRTLHEHVEALTIRRDRLPAPQPPTREQIAEALELEGLVAVPKTAVNNLIAAHKHADQAVALLQKGGER